MLTVDNITYSYPGAKAPTISGLSTEFRAGSICGLLGTNGTGKSTLLYLCAGLLRPHQGRVTLDGTDTCLRKPSTLSEIFLLSEEFELPAIELGKFVKRNAPFYPRFSHQEFISHLDGFHLTADMNLGRASMGQRKKAMIAFALACNTGVLLMDEPTNGLDIPGKSEFRRALVSAATEERAIVISTHQVRDLDRVLDRVMIIDGQGPSICAGIADLQERYQFLFTHNPEDTLGALWMQPTMGGYNLIRRREEGMEETDVNLESLFEFVTANNIHANNIQL